MKPRQLQQNSKLKTQKGFLKQVATIDLSKVDEALNSSSVERKPRFNNKLEVKQPDNLSSCSANGHPIELIGSATKSPSASILAFKEARERHKLFK